jgi:DNA-binding HxlR family transcriptional regulator
MSHDPSSPVPLHSGCSIETTFTVLGGRWKAVVLYWLLKDKRRFGELRRLLPNCTQRVLTVQLRELERDGLVTRTVFPAVPPHVEYALTPLGRTLEPLLRHVAEWGLQYQTHRTAQPISAEMLAHCAD